MKKIFIVLAILLLAISLTGCKEKSNTDGASDDTGMESGSAESDVKETSGSDWSDKFSDLVRMKSNAEYKVTYDFETDQPEMEDASMTYYVKGQDKIRIDTKMNIQGQDMEVRTFMMDDTVTSCNNQDGWQCMQVSGVQKQQDISSQFEDVEKFPDKYDIHFTGTKMVAGKTAICYDISVTDRGESIDMKQCLSKEGVPLYLEVSHPDGETVMTATSFSSSVRDSDFELPAEPQDMNAMYKDAMDNMPKGYDKPDY